MICVSFFFMNDIIYADVPKDLMKIKTKFLFNLTKRQLCCFGGGALVGVPLYFLTRDMLPCTMSMLLMIGVMKPFFLFALYEKNGQPLEKNAHYFIEARLQSTALAVPFTATFCYSVKIIVKYTQNFF